MPKRVSPWPEKVFTETAKTGFNPDVSPSSGKPMIEILVGPAGGPKIRALCRPEERICMPKIIKQKYITD